MALLCFYLHLAKTVRLLDLHREAVTSLTSDALYKEMQFKVDSWRKRKVFVECNHCNGMWCMLQGAEVLAIGYTPQMPYSVDILHI